MSTGLQGLPRNLGRYELVGVLGQGGMGRVLRAHDPVLKRDIALKLFEPAGLDAAALAEARFMFHREARATAALRHPSILEIYDYSGLDAEVVYLACELLAGPTLREALAPGVGLAAEIVAALGHELATALEHAHARGIIHRDLKPENVFWLEGGRIVLADFGIAKALDGAKGLGDTVQFGPTSIYGSPAYMAPEQLAAEAIGPRTDLHALGAILFEAATGRQAFDGIDVEAILRAVQAEDRPSCAGQPNLPVELTALVDALLARSPDARPAGATVVVRRLRQILDALAVADPRVCLRSFGDDSVTLPADRAVDVEVDEDTPRPFPGEPTEAARTIWTQHGPLLFGTALLAAGMGVISYLLVDLKVAINGLGRAAAESPAAVDAEGAGDEVSGQVPVLIRFVGRGVVRVDGEIMGTADDALRLALSPGPHALQVEVDGVRFHQDVVVLAGTEPVFNVADMSSQNPRAP